MESLFGIVRDVLAGVWILALFIIWALRRSSSKVSGSGRLATVVDVRSTVAGVRGVVLDIGDGELLSLSPHESIGLELGDKVVFGRSGQMLRVIKKEESL